MKIAVFMGGSSEEREISLRSGSSIVEALKLSFQEVAPYDVEWKGKQTLFDAVQECVQQGTDLVFNTLHGGLGENGGVQSVLEAAGLTYTGSGILASGIAMNKNVSKILFRYHGIPTADWICADSSDISLDQVRKKIGFPCIVKPNDQGSSVGVYKVDESSELPEKLEKAGAFGSPVMVERYIPGRELSVPVLGENPLPVIEIRPKHGIYDYECKYTSGMSEYFVPAPIPEPLARTLGELALRVFRVLGLRDIARIDFRLDADGNPVCFEANTLPGMTSTSLVPKSAAFAGIPFPELIRRIAHYAFQRKGTEIHGHPDL